MPLPGSSLDHVAVAVERWQDAWPRYAVQLGGSWRSGGLSQGFGPCQLRYANEAKLEILQPWDWEANDFLRRFLDRHGPGPHHMTFTVSDIEAALDQLRAAGYQPVGVDLSDPEWREAFLHPRQAHGIVVQVAQPAGTWTSDPPPEFPATREAPALLRHVTLAVADLARARSLFEGLLGGRETAAGGEEGTGDEARSWVELAWSGALRLRLVSPAAAVPAAAASATTAVTPNAPGGGALGAWLGDLPGRLHHLAFAGVAADALTGPGARPVVTGSLPAVAPGDPSADVVVEPEDNLGVRLVLSTATP